MWQPRGGDGLDTPRARPKVSRTSGYPLFYDGETCGGGTPCAAFIGVPQMRGSLTASGAAIGILAAAGGATPFRLPRHSTPRPLGNCWPKIAQLGAASNRTSSRVSRGARSNPWPACRPDGICTRRTRNGLDRSCHDAPGCSCVSNSEPKAARIALAENS